MQTQTQNRAKFNSATVSLFAKLCMANPEVAMSAVRGLADPEEAIDALKPFPGALEKLYLSDSCPRHLKDVLLDVLEETGMTILS